MAELVLSNSELKAQIDDADLLICMMYTWRLRHDGYVIGGERTYLHHHIMGRTGIDHKDRNPLNNRRENLRVASQQQNMMNKGKIKRGGASKYKGVYKYKQKWKSQIQLHGKQMHIGVFVTELEAAQAYNRKAKELFGEFAHLNDLGEVHGISNES